MKDQLITFGTAKLAKEKGFNITVTSMYRGDGSIRTGEDYLQYLCLGDTCVAPTQSLLQKWLREEHNIHLTVDNGINGYYCYLRIREIGKLVENHKTDEFWVNEQGNPSKTYEEALGAGLVEALNLV